MNQGTTDITCLQVLLEDASVCSTQRVTLPPGSDITPSSLFDLYLGYVARFTLGIINPVRSNDKVHFRVRGTGISLISFNGPLYGEAGSVQSIEMKITGGVLVQPDNCHRGLLQFSVEKTDTGVDISLHLADYCPIILGNSTPSRWRKWLYRLTQAYIHRVVTIRFLKLVVKTLSAGQLCARVVTVKPSYGERI